MKVRCIATACDAQHTASERTEGTLSFDVEEGEWYVVYGLLIRRAVHYLVQTHSLYPLYIPAILFESPVGVLPPNQRLYVWNDPDFDVSCTMGPSFFADRAFYDKLLDDDKGCMAEWRTYKAYADGYEWTCERSLV